jgi:hypothetical protein
MARLNLFSRKRKPSLNASLAEKDRVVLKKFVRNYPKTLSGVRELMNKLTTFLVRVGTKNKEAEYNKTAIQTIQDGRINVKFSRKGEFSFPYYGCHQMCKVMHYALREMGIPSRIIREYPKNHSFVMFKLNKTTYVADPFNTTIQEYDRIVRLDNKELNEKEMKHKAIRPIRPDYSYMDYLRDKKLAKSEKN